MQEIHKIDLLENLDLNGFIKEFSNQNILINLI